MLNVPPQCKKNRTTDHVRELSLRYQVLRLGPNKLLFKLYKLSTLRLFVFQLGDFVCNLSYGESSFGCAFEEDSNLGFVVSTGLDGALSIPDLL